MNALFNLIGIPLGWLLELIYNLIPNYFGAIFVFTLVIRLLMFPLSLKSQKSQADRARLSPKLERLQKKYQKDPKKLQEKQLALYEKEGVSMTGGCLPMLVQMVVLFGIISVIYSPVTHLTSVPETVVNVSVSAMSSSEENAEELGKIPAAQFSGYYKELRMLLNLEDYETEVKENIKAIEGYTSLDADKYYNEMVEIKDQFTFFNRSLLQNPWNSKGFADISLLWLIPLLSGLTAMLSSLISMHFTKQMTSSENQQPGMGCSNNAMMIIMPLFSLFITFSVPGGVGIYWISSNIIALVQTLVLNSIYNPAKIRAQAEIEYEERRKQRQEDKKRLAEARAREQRALAAELNEQKKGGEKSPSKKKPAKEQSAETPETSTEQTTDEQSPETEEKG